MSYVLATFQLRCVSITKFQVLYRYLWFAHLWNLIQDEDIYTFFEPELPSEAPAPGRPQVPTPVRTSVSKLPVSKSGSKAARLKKQRSLSTLERNTGYPVIGGASQSTVLERMSLHEGSSVLDLRGDNYFSCSVARKRSNARYLLGSSDDVVKLLRELADS